MTYCCGILVSDDLVKFADTRTNAGVDNISTFRKLHVVVQPGMRIMAFSTAGNLSISQSVVSMLHEGLENPDTGEKRNAYERADHVPGGTAHRPRRPPRSRRE
jgi:putative proteasome-type protease